MRMPQNKEVIVRKFILYTSIYIYNMFIVNISADVKLRDQQSDSLSLEDDEYYNRGVARYVDIVSFIAISLLGATVTASLAI